MIRDEVIEKIQSRRAVIGIVGLGYVGLPLVLHFGEERFPILGFDIDRDKVRDLNAGRTYIRHIPAERISTLRHEQRFEATSDFSRLSEADAIIICVPTPLTPRKEPDLRFIEQTAESVGQTLRSGQVICLESTTYPGTTEEILLGRFRSTNLAVGQDYFLVYSPEREDPGNARFSIRTIPKVVGGTTPNCLEVGKTLYGQVIDRIVPVSSTGAAELAKLLENIYRAVNIALVNELKLLTDRMGIDIWEVIDAASTKPFGFTPFYPGPGLGGHCIPIDPFYLSWKARECGFATRFIELAGEVNTSIPRFVVEKLAGALNDRSKPVRGANILILGVAYKRDIDDVRESPALEIMHLLEQKGAVVSYTDPYVPRLRKMRAYDFSRLSSIPLTAEVLREQDAVVIVTDHAAFDYAWIVEHSSLILDTRNATHGIVRGHERIVRA